MGNLILHKNNVISHSTNKCTEDWVRNPDWMDFPTTLVPTDETLYVLVAVFEDDFNRITMRCDNTSALIEWGDGTTQVPSSYTIYNKVYDYSTISGSINVYKDGRNYKQVMIKVSGTNIFGIQMNGNSGTINSNGASNTLDIYGSLPNCQNLGISTAIYHPYLERARFISLNSPVNMNQSFTNCSQLQVFEIPDWNHITNTYNMFNGTNLRTIGDLSITSSQDIRTMFYASSIEEVGDITATNILNNLGFTVFNGCQNLIKVGNIQNTSTDVSRFFQSCTNLREIGIWTFTSVTTNISNIFYNCRLIDTIVFAGDMSGITTTTNAFLNCGNLRKLIMPGITVGFTIANCQLGTQELDDLFTSLGTASGSQTIIVTGNPGAATCDTSIATGKGWTVTI